jgi:hypothetical protein
MKVSVIHSAFDDTPHVVAFVDAPEGTEEMEALEYAYRWTNNVMGSWSIKKEVFEGGESNGDFNPNVTVMAPLHVDDSGKEWGLRSTSVGDQMLVGTKKYEVASFGFKEVA